MPIGFSNKPVLWGMDGGRKIRTLLRSFRLSFDTNGFLFLNAAYATEHLIFLFDFFKAQNPQLINESSFK